MKDVPIRTILTEVSEGARKVNDLIAEIAESSKEQSQGIGEVNTAISNLDKITQESAANNEESASAGEELNAQASSLANTVAAFKLASARSTSTASNEPAPSVNNTKPTPKKGSTVNNKCKNSSIKNDNSGKTDQMKVLVPLDDDDFRGFEKGLVRRPQPRPPLMVRGF